MNVLGFRVRQDSDSTSLALEPDPHVGPGSVENDGLVHGGQPPSKWVYPQHEGSKPRSQGKYPKMSEITPEEDVLLDAASDLDDRPYEEQDQPDE